MCAKEKSLEEIAKAIAEKVADEFMKSILSRLVTETIGLRKDVDELKQSMTKVWKAIDKLTQKINELTEAQKRTEERLNRLTKQVNSLTEQVNSLATQMNSLTAQVNSLTKQVNSLTEQVNSLATQMNSLTAQVNSLTKQMNILTTQVDELAKAQIKTEKRLNSLIGEVANIRGELIETKVVMDLNMFLSKRGFDVFHHFPNVPFVDVVVETNSFTAAIEVCKRCDVRDIEQVIRGAEVLKALEGIEADVLVVFSYTGDIDEMAVKEAKKKGVIIESSTRKLVKKLLELSKRKNK
ncbi:MAG: hypothetical protein ACP6IQ_06330 [Candidatus Njordarchaeia archaeon]